MSLKPPKADKADKKIVEVKKVSETKIVEKKQPKPAAAVGRKALSQIDLNAIETDQECDTATTTSKTIAAPANFQSQPATQEVQVRPLEYVGGRITLDSALDQMNDKLRAAQAAPLDAPPPNPFVKELETMLRR